jgi:hypothetical protein
MRALRQIEHAKEYTPKPVKLKRAFRIAAMPALHGLRFRHGALTQRDNGPTLLWR